MWRINRCFSLNTYSRLWPIFILFDSSHNWVSLNSTIDLYLFVIWVFSEGAYKLFLVTIRLSRNLVRLISILVIIGVILFLGFFVLFYLNLVPCLLSWFWHVSTGLTFQLNCAFCSCILEARYSLIICTRSISNWHLLINIYYIFLPFF